MKMNWVPLEGVGGIRFNEKLPRTLNLLALSESGSGMTRYALDNGNAIISCELGRVAFIECIDEAYYLNEQLIGKSLQELYSIVRGDWVRRSEDSVICDDFGIIGWLESGKIEAITVWGPGDCNAGAVG